MAKINFTAEPGGNGETIGEIVSEGGSGIDFVAVVTRSIPIRSAVICCEDETRDFCVDGYAVLQHRTTDEGDDATRDDDTTQAGATQG